MSKNNVMQAWVMLLLSFFDERAFVRTYQQLATKVGKSVAHIRRYLGPHVLTSLNKNREYVTSKKTVAKNCDRYGFFVHPSTGAVFHKNGDIKSTLLYLAKRIDWGITAAEAEKRCGRSCARPLKELLEVEKLIAAHINGEYVYFHPKRYKNQFRNRYTNRKISPASDKQKDEPPILPLENILETLRMLTISELDRDDLEKFCIVLLQYYEQETYRGYEARLFLDARLREMLDISLHEVPDHTSLWRIFDSLTIEQVRSLFNGLLMQLKCMGVIRGRYLVVDASHIFAWACTHKTINDHEICGAAWGVHQGSFYGYKVHILIDPEVELPVAIKLTHGNAADRDWVIPLLDDADRTIGLEELQAIFGDATYYDEPLFKDVEKRYKVTLNTVINPRRNKILKSIKKWVKKVFQKHGAKIETVADALDRMPQKLLTDFGVEIGSTRDSMIASAVRERLNRHLRSAVERVLSRAKHFFWLERPRTRDIGRVAKHVLMGFIAMLLVALTANRLGWKRNSLSLAKVC